MAPEGVSGDPASPRLAGQEVRDLAGHYAGEPVRSVVYVPIPQQWVHWHT